LLRPVVNFMLEEIHGCIIQRARFMAFANDIHTAYIHCLHKGLYR
jgi:hypothetical protein